MSVAVSQQTIAVQFGIAKSTADSIKKNRDTILRLTKKIAAMKGNENYEEHIMRMLIL
jgi:hypothetical protein